MDDGLPDDAIMTSLQPDTPAQTDAQGNDTPVTTTESATTKPLPKPTTAGFILEDSEEEDEESAPNGITATQVENTSIPSQAPDVQISSAATQDPTSVLPSALQTAATPNGSAAVPAPTLLSAATVAPVPSVDSPVPTPLSGQPAGSVATPVQDQIANVPAASTIFRRLPHDKVGQLEDRISDEPRADPDAWTSLIAYYKEKDQIDSVRRSYDRFLEVYPTAAYVWLDYLNFEQEQDDAARIDALLSKALFKTPNVDLWLFYINVLRRRHPLLNDVDGKNRGVISNGFTFVLDKVGIDPDAGILWREYIEFLKSGPGTITANSNHWQDQQKLDLLRKAYHRAVAIPTDELVKLWKEYDNLENTFNRAAARKLINERSPHYMTAKVAKSQLDERLQGLDRKSLPVLPPLPGYTGDDEFGNQVRMFRNWINWEKSDELVLKQDDDLEGYRKRIDYAYKQATIGLRFYPEIWFEAAAWCFEQGTEHWRKEGEAYLDGGIIANPESPLLALRKADVVELSFRGKGDSEEIVLSNGSKLDVVYETVHKSLYLLKTRYQQREERALADVEEHFTNLPEEAPKPILEDDDDDEDGVQKPKTRDEEKAAQIAMTKSSFVSLQDLLKRTISYVWVARMRSFRRIQGQGKPEAAKKGFRGVFAEARRRGGLTSDVYIAAALMEHRSYADMPATKIFERGLKLFPTDELFILEYIKFLVNKNDLTNAKAVFETSITKMEKNESYTREQQQRKCRLLLDYMHDFESSYGDLASIARIEKRMADLYPDEPELVRFVDRFSLPGFDGVKTPLVVSATQIRPKLPQIEQPMPPPQAVENGMLSPQPGQLLLGPHGPYIASPKRPLEDSEDGTPGRKFLRGDSPLKGAAGRRIATAAGAATAAIAAPSVTNNGFVTKSYAPGQASQPPTPLPAAIFSLLSVLPPAASYIVTRFDPAKMVDFIRNLDLNRAQVT